MTATTATREISTIPEASKTTATSTPTQPAEMLTSQKPTPTNFDPVKQSFDIPKDLKFDPAGPRPDQIVILTATDGKGHNGGIQNIVHNALENRKEFCDAHGYINHFINITKYNMGEDAHPVRQSATLDEVKRN